MIPVAEDHDSTTVIVFKLVITILTLGVLAFTTIGEAYRILSYRFGKFPRMGFIIPPSS